MVEMIGLVAMSALIWVLAWAMGAENSEAERRARHDLPRQMAGDAGRSEQPARHAA